MSDGSRLPPKVTVLIVNWNGKRFLKALFDSLLATAYENLDILVVDNGSSEGDQAILASVAARSPQVRVVYLERNLGFAGGNNEGLGHVSQDTRYVCFLNSDVLVDPGWLKPLVDFLEAHPEVAIAQPKLLRPENHLRLDRGPLTVDRLGYDIYDIFTTREDGPDLEGPHPVFSVSGAAFLARRSVLEMVGFDGNAFDPSYFTYYEETDLCWRVRLAGHEVWFCPASRVYHYRGGATRPSGKIPAPLVFHHTKNRLAALLKNYGRENLVLWFPLLFLSETFRALATAPLNRDHSREILRGQIWVLTHWKEVIARRRFVQGKVRKVPDHDALALMAFPNPLRLLYNFRKVYHAPPILPSPDIGGELALQQP